MNHGRQQNLNEQLRMFPFKRHISLCLPTIYLPAALFLILLSGSQVWSSPYFALEPLDTSSPRATMESFLRYSKAYGKALRSPGEVTFTADAALARAIRCFDLSEVPPVISENVGRESVLLLREIVNRIPVPALEGIPDGNEVRKDEIERWYIPHTGITMRRTSEGNRKNEFLFSPDTVSRLSRYYEEIRHLPNREGVFENIYQTSIYA